MVARGVVGQNGWGSLSGDQEIRRTGNQGNRRVGNFEIRMDSVSKPTLSKKSLP